MRKNELLLSVVIPTFNEEPTVGDVITRLKVTLQKTGLKHELIVVDDCSTDRSPEISKNNNARVHLLQQHMGKGCALRTGFIKAKGEIIATIDSDGSHRPEELPLLLSPILLDQADFVIGSRYLNKKSTSAKKLNAIGVRLFNALIEILTGTSVTDSQSGYRVIKSRVLRASRLVSAGYEIESEMLVQTARKGFRIKEVPISFEQRTYGRSRLDPMVDGFRILLSIVAAYIKGGYKQ